FRLEGRNADGSPNPAYETLLDVDNLIDYMLVILYGGNLDAPISNFLGNTSPNNWYGQRDRTGRHGGFRFTAHDSEHTLLNVAENRTGPYGTATSWSLPKSNPQYLWQQLSANAEFRLRVADHVQKHFFNDGALTPAAARARFSARTNELFSAVVAESARWGDSKVSAPLNRDQHWLPRVRDILANYMGQRTANVLAQLRTRNLYPATVAPAFSQHGGNVPAGFRVGLSAPTGEIRYTLDGSDPRTIGGAAAPGSRVYSGDILIDQSTAIRARVLAAGTWSALTEASFTVLQTFDTLRITEIAYHPAAEGSVDGDAFEFLELKNVGASTLDLSGVRCV
ncbi:MAG: chitobiase/beta-hexosaminidase C-terminal domain-containing protein, partial [Verrucomicrobiota bacterium]